MKKETQEAAREYWKRGQFGLEKAADTERAFLKGAKWQAERMFSEEDIDKAFDSGYEMLVSQKKYNDVLQEFKESLQQAKWQTERMYSQEEVKTLIDIINWYDDNSDVRPNFEIPEIKKGIALIDWFIDFEEQFKKK